MNDRATIEPEPTEEEREAILAALAGSVGDDDGGWAGEALREGVDDSQPDPQPPDP